MQVVTDRKFEAARDNKRVISPFMKLIKVLIELINKPLDKLCLEDK